MELKPRYIRDQLGILLKLQEEYSKDELSKAVDYCTERNIFSANDFKDTLEYFRQKETAPVITKVSIPIKYSLIVAQTRPIEAYASLCNGGSGR